MRFLRLDLRCFGPFENAPALDLGGGDRGFHLILGPNEAGKSTALRAIRHLLFGFPKSTEDRHGRPYDALRIGATLRAEAGGGGGELAFVRRKRDVKPLWTADDSGPIAADALAPFLGGVDAAKFDDFFAMDHAELVAGGRAILGGGGRLGEMLFAAGSGLTRLEEVRRSLEAEMDLLFKPRASVPAINAALAELKDARAAADRAMLGTEKWVELDEQLARDRGRLAGVDAEWRRVDAEKRRLENLLKALPVIARREATARDLAGRGDVPVLADGFADRRHDATAGLALATRAARDAGRAIEDVDRDLGALGPPDPIVDEGDAVRRVRDDLGLYRKAVEGRPDALARLARLEDDARALLAELRPGAPLDDAEGLRVPAALKESIQALSQEFGRLDDRCSAAGADVARLVAACPAADGPGPGPAAPRLAEALAEVVARGQALGDGEGRLAAALDDLDRAERQAGVDLLALPLWSGTLADLEALATPSTATLDRFESGLRAADEAVDRAGDDLARAEADRLKLGREIERARLAGAAPTEEELGLRRAARDDAWRRARRAWIDREPEPDPARLAAEFESGLRAADDAADRLRREADRVAEQAQRALGLREALDRIAALAAALDRATAARDAIGRDWADLWRASGLAPLPPREMKDWVVQGRADLVRKAQALRDRRADVAARSARVEAARAELGRHLAGLGEPPADPREPLAALLGRARAAVDRVGVALQLAAARATLVKAEADRDAWRGRWAVAVGPLGLGGDAAPAQAHAAVARLDELAGMLREGRDLRAAIDDQARVEGRFEAAVGALVARLAPALAGGPIEASAVELAARLDRAGVAEARREEARKRRADEQARLAEARLATDKAGSALAALAAEARCESPAVLPEAERASDEVRSLRRDLRALDDQLATLAGSAPVARLVEEAEGADPATLEARLVDLADRLAPLEEDRRQLGEEIGRCRERLDKMDGGPAAADARQDLEGRVAGLAADVERYARLRLASAVLRDAVERHREKHQGPVLARAGALFAGLTAGSFAGLHADLDDKGQPILRGLRADGATLLDVAALSEGTADQLYLALRLASLATYLDDHEPMPVVLDDVLVNFDNDRARAALEALADLSRRTQVLFFTHHDHLADLARAALPADVLFVHRLTREAPPVDGQADADVPPIEATRPRRKKKVATPADGP